MGFSNSDFEKRVDQINWSDYSTAYGNASVVAKQLKELTSTNPKLAMAASHDLWCGLCHQHAYISSAALPAFPLLIDVLKSTDEKLMVEILDIITGIAVCAPARDEQETAEAWSLELGEKLDEQFSLFQELKAHTNAEISGFSESILEAIAEKNA